MNKELQLALARVRRIEQHQQTMVNWLLPADQSPPETPIAFQRGASAVPPPPADRSPLETPLAFEQVAIEVTAHVAMHEPDPYLAQVYRFGMLEDFDHLYRYSSLIDRLEGKDANNITQSYTDITAGRPTREEHRAP